MKLSILERILVSQLLPAQGSFANLKLLRKTREDLSFNEEENARLNFRQVGEQTFWDSEIIFNKITNETAEGDSKLIEKLLEKYPDKYERRPSVEDKDFEFGQVVTDMLVKKLQEMDENEQLTDQHLSLLEKFFPEEAELTEDEEKEQLQKRLRELDGKDVVKEEPIDLVEKTEET